MNRYRYLMKSDSGFRISKFAVFFCVSSIIIYILQKIFGTGLDVVLEDIKGKAVDFIGQSAVDVCITKIDVEDINDKTLEARCITSLVTNVIMPGASFYAKGYVDNSFQAPVYEESSTTQTLPETSEDITQTTESLPPQTTEAAAPPAVNSSIMEAAAQVYPMEKLMDYNYVLNNFYVVPSVTTLKPELLKPAQLAATDLTIKKDASQPQILIFHTHGHETFADSGDNGRTIVDVGTYLTELLTSQYGYNVMHITDSFDVVDGVLDRSKAYTYANERLEQILTDNPSIQVVIDLHRDGVPQDQHLVTDINGKNTAKIMLFNGISYTNEQGAIDYLYNPYLNENLAMTYKMYLIGKVQYPDFIRCIYISGYRYCLHHRGRSMLIEAGAQTNTYQEVYNAMEPLAQMLDRELTYN